LFIHSSNFKEQLAIVGRANIAKRQQEQLTKIQAKRKAALAKLDKDYELADKVKTSFGIISIIYLSSIWFLVILNDLMKLFHLCYEETKSLIKEKQQENIKIKEEQKREQVKIQLEEEENEEYSNDLEQKLAKIHMQLLKACAKRRACEKK
jgi:hypothetical protein